MKRTILILLFLFSIFSLHAQKLTLDGYVKEMEGVYFFEEAIPISLDKEVKTISYNLIHNRLNFKTYPIKNLVIDLEMRNRLYSGKLIGQIPGYANAIAADSGLVDLSWNIAKGEKYFLNTSIDRIFIDYTLGKWQIRVGRQRINWGINLVWNPNDIFNAFSYMDFDYEERPGSDAILISWYPSGSSSFDLAYKASKLEKERTLAAKYRFNLFDYDFQFLAGQTGYDYVLGGGWSGAIWNLSFRGEASWFKPQHQKEKLSEEAFSATVSLDYTFSNSLYLHTSFLYNSMGTTGKGMGYSLINPNQQLSAKNLSIGKYELFGQLSYSFGSLVNSSIAAMYNPVDFSIYVGPSVAISLHNDIEFFLTSQLLFGDKGSEYGSLGDVYSFFGRLRWSF
ncbi:MAG TPA: hypothetical protein PKH79_01570 [Prolixibacteraceae bacterium]|mgnify:CR=1 FL=1|nr:hypothetical protein [Prolixibacteraceae bacterium]HPS12102.1 hypothetical protein [Prolixibacteraceae bacterium]